MRVLSLPVNDNMLEVHINLWSGKELVLWNGEQMSKKTHFLGTNHHFSVPADDGYGTDAIHVKTSYHWMGYVYDVFRNGKCLLASGKTRLSHRNRRKMPTEERLDLNRRVTPSPRAQPEPLSNWSDEDLIV